MAGKKKDKSDAGVDTHCFKCGEKITAHTLFCLKCDRQQFLPMEALERAYDDNLPVHIELLEKELKDDPKNFYRHFTLGNALFLNGDYRGAVHRFRMTLDLKPDFSDARLNLGNTLRLLGEKGAAIEALETFRKEHPHSNKIEAVQQMICEMQGIPWKPKKPAGPPPEIIKPGIGRKKSEMKRERLNIPAFVFSVIILIIILFGFVRKDVFANTVDRTFDAVSLFLSSEVKGEGLAENKSEDEKAESPHKANGNDLLARLFNRRDVESKLEDDDWKENPAERPKDADNANGETPGPSKPETKDPNAPLNLEPEHDSYWPMSAGNFWKYSGYELDSRAGLVAGSEKKDSIVIDSIAKSGDVPVYKVTHLGNKSYFYENSEGIYKTNYPDRPFSTGVPALIKPVVIGEKNTDLGLGQGYEVLEEKDIRVPAGLFRTMRIKTWLPDMPDQYTEIFFAKGVGPVKLVTGSPKKGFRIWEMTAYKLN